MRGNGKRERRNAAIAAGERTWRERAAEGRRVNGALFSKMDWQTDAAVRALRGEVLLAAARLGKKRRRRREALLFAFCACAFALLLGLSLWLALAGGARGAALCAGIKAALVCAGATLLFSPLLAYFMERRGKHA